MTSHQSVHCARLDKEVLDQWVDAGWLTPHQNATGQRFSSVDLARAYLIRDLQDLGVNDDGIPIILDLVDQVHGLRYVLRELLSTINAQQGHGRA
jgi:chaperone modulatory protein CbpM